MPEKFPMGRVVITPSALLRLVPEDVAAALKRHSVGDWGNVDEEDLQQNEYALLHGMRLFSVYADRANVAFWIITECDRSATTVLLPEDY